MSDRRGDGAVRDRAREGLDLGGGVETILAEVARSGFALVRGAVPSDDRDRLLAETDRERAGFLRLPPKVNGVRQRADQLTLRIGDPRHPEVNGLAASLRNLLTSGPDTFGVHGFQASEGRYMRYPADTGGLGVHRDGKCYSLMVAVYSLVGTAPFELLPDETEPDGAAVTVLVEPGDLILLRAPGFAGRPDGRRRHAVGAPLAGERVSFTLRMVGRRGAARGPARWPRVAGGPVLPPAPFPPKGAPLSPPVCRPSAS